MNLEELLEYDRNNLEIEDDAENESESFYYSISSYGADYSTDVLISRLRRGQIFVPPFQRRYVWPIQKASRFIESLLLGLPVPGVFLSQESQTNRLLIVDGQQRLLSLFKYYEGAYDEKKIFKLTGVGEEYNGLTYKDLKESDKNRLDDAVIHATIIKQDKPTDDDSSIYMVFERLNTGGLPLQPQEIRACIYYGAFNEMLSQLIQNDIWRGLFKKENPRMKEQELLLRYYTLYHEWRDYKRGLKGFMNSFMARNRDFQLYSADTLKDAFLQPLATLVNAVNENVFKLGKKLNAAIFDSIMIGVNTNLANGTLVNINEINTRYLNILGNNSYLELVKQSTSSEKSVKGRISMAIDAFHA